MFLFLVLAVGCALASPLSPGARQFSDMALSEQQNRAIRMGLRDTVQRWPGASVPYRVREHHFDDNENVMVILAITLFNADSACVKFRPADNSDTDYVLITSDNTGCWSYSGRLGGGPQQLNLQNDTDTMCLDFYTVQHVLSLAAGSYNVEDDPLETGQISDESKRDFNFPYSDDSYDSGLLSSYDDDDDDDDGQNTNFISDNNNNENENELPILTNADPAPNIYDDDGFLEKDEQPLYNFEDQDPNLLPSSNINGQSNSDYGDSYDNLVNDYKIDSYYDLPDETANDAYLDPQSDVGSLATPRYDIEDQNPNIFSNYDTDTKSDPYNFDFDDTYDDYLHNTNNENDIYNSPLLTHEEKKPDSYDYFGLFGDDNGENGLYNEYSDKTDDNQDLLPLSDNDLNIDSGSVYDDYNDVSNDSNEVGNEDELDNWSWNDTYILDLDRQRRSLSSADVSGIAGDSNDVEGTVGKQAAYLVKRMSEDKLKLDNLYGCT